MTAISMRRQLLLAVQVTVLCIVALAIYLGRDHLRRIPRPSFLHQFSPEERINVTIEFDDIPPPASPALPSPLAAENVTRYVGVIMSPESTELPRMACPPSQLERYSHLKEGDHGDEYEFFFALDLRQVLPLLPRLIGSVVDAIRFLGPERCVLSIVEGNSDDGTAQVLSALRPELEAMVTTYYFKTTDVNPSDGDRITKLAELRNMALQPLVDSPSRYSRNATVVFLNDVAICTEDILELAHQRRVQGADMTCAMDWTYAGQDPTFYDVWIARTLAGDSFFEIPPGGNWDLAWNLFWNDGRTQSLYYNQKPFQVFSCWNGAVAFTATPLLDGLVRFRAAREGECTQGEPQLFCKDMWSHGNGKMAVVPAVSLEYSDKAGQDIKDLKGYTSKWTGLEDREYRIKWEGPPEKVKCIPTYEHQYWEPWNVTLV